MVLGENHHYPPSEFGWGYCRKVFNESHRNDAFAKNSGASQRNNTRPGINRASGYREMG
jgi:hypothetical protein